MTAPTPDELAAIRARADAATEGPWRIPDKPWSVIASRSDSVLHGYVSTSCPSCDEKIEDDAEVSVSVEDLEFMAHARTDIPLLLDEIERLRIDADHHALANGGCVPRDAYREAGDEIERLRAQVAAVERLCDQADTQRHDIFPTVYTSALRKALAQEPKR